jgi:hypothetical protein
MRVTALFAVVLVVLAAGASAATSKGDRVDNARERLQEAASAVHKVSGGKWAHFCFVCPAFASASSSRVRPPFRRHPTPYALNP